MKVKEVKLNLSVNPFLWPFIDIEIFEKGDSSPKFFCSVPLLKFSEDFGIQKKNTYLRMIGKCLVKNLNIRLGG
jgi:hypothetical protein